MILLGQLSSYAVDLAMLETENDFAGATELICCAGCSKAATGMRRVSQCLGVGNVQVDPIEHDMKVYWRALF